MGLLQSGDLPMNLLIFFFLFFSSNIVDFKRNNVPVNRVFRMNPIQGETQFIGVVSAPLTKSRLVFTAQSKFEFLVCIAGAPFVGNVTIERHIYSANVPHHPHRTGGTPYA